MAKSNTVLIKLVSSADTGFYYVTKKNPRTKTERLELKKYDHVARKHVAFNAAKINKAPSRRHAKKPLGRAAFLLSAFSVEPGDGYGIAMRWTRGGSLSCWMGQAAI